MKTGHALLSLCAFAFGAAAAAAAPEAPRKPTERWVVDYGETTCSASRFYGGADDPITLGFVPSPMGDVVRVALVRPKRGPSTVFQFDVKANVSNRRLKMNGLRFASDDKKSDVVWINFERAVLDQVRDAGEISIKGGGMDERLAVPGFSGVLKALDTCTDDLRRHWNATEASFTALSRPATPVRPLSTYVSSSDIPGQAMRDGADGTTGVMLMIDETGKAKNCMVDQTSGFASLDLVSCAVFVQRAKFHPALDRSGKPVRSVIGQKIRWVTPD